MQKVNRDLTLSVLVDFPNDVPGAKGYVSRSVFITAPGVETNREFIEYVSHKVRNYDYFGMSEEEQKEAAILALRPLLEYSLLDFYVSGYSILMDAASALRAYEREYGHMPDDIFDVMSLAEDILIAKRIMSTHPEDEREAVFEAVQHFEDAENVSDFEFPRMVSSTRDDGRYTFNIRWTDLVDWAVRLLSNVNE